MANILSDEPFYGENWNFLSRPSIELLALGSVVEPSLCREVDRLSDVQARGEAGMIRPWHGQDVLAWLLQSFVDLDLLLLQVSR